MRFFYSVSLRLLIRPTAASVKCRIQELLLLLDAGCHTFAVVDTVASENSMGQPLAFLNGRLGIHSLRPSTYMDYDNPRYAIIGHALPFSHYIMNSLPHTASFISIMDTYDIIFAGGSLISY